MVKEVSGAQAKDMSFSKASTVADVECPVKIVGETIDRVFKNGKLVEEIKGHNLVVNQFLNLCMALMKGESGYTGLTYWAVGSGSDSWDSTMPSPAVTDTALTNEIGRVAINPSEISFLDAGGNVSATPTNIIQIVHTFGINDCNGKWREFGIFGGTATSASGSGVMINKRHHAVITKSTDMTIERTMRFTITLA